MDNYVDFPLKNRMTLIITCFVNSYQYALKVPIVESFSRLFVSLIHIHILKRLFIVQTSG